MPARGVEFEVGDECEEMAGRLEAGSRKRAAIAAAEAETVTATMTNQVFFVRGKIFIPI